MTAEEFVKAYASIAPSIEFLIQCGYSLNFAKESVREYFVEKRSVPLGFEESFMFDETLVLIRNYNVSPHFRVVNQISFHVFNPREEGLDFKCLINKAIPIGNCANFWCVINFDTDEIELRPLEDLSASVVDNIQGFKVAKNGASFFDAIVKFTPVYDDTLHSRKVRGEKYYNQGEKDRMNSIMPEVIRLAGGEQYRPFWYSLIDFLED